MPPECVLPARLAYETAGGKAGTGPGEHASTAVAPFHRHRLPAKTAPAKTSLAVLSAALSTGAGKTGGETGGKVEDTGTTGKGVEGGAVVSALHTADRSVTLSSLRILRQYVRHSLNLMV